MDKRELCPVVETARLMEGKWDLIVIRYLMDRPRRFADLKAAMSAVSSKSLSLALRQLARKGLVERRVNAGFPVTVEYSLTKKGREMRSIIEAMRRWGRKWALQGH